MPNGGSDVTGSFNMTIDGVSTAFGYTVRPAGMNSLSLNSGGFAGLWGFYPAGFGVAISGYTFAGNWAVGGGPSTQTTLSAVGSTPSGGTNGAWGSTSASTYVNGDHYVDITYN